MIGVARVSSVACGCGKDAHVEAAYNGRQRSVTEVIPTGKPGGTGSGAKATLSTKWAPKKGRSGVDVVSRNSNKEAIGAGKSQPRKSGSALFGRVLFIDVAWIVLVCTKSWLGCLFLAQSLQRWLELRTLPTDSTSSVFFKSHFAIHLNSTGCNPPY